MKRLENYILQRGYNPDTIICAHGEVYGHKRFEDGANITTSRVVKVKDGLLTTKSGSVYQLGTPHEIMSKETSRDYELYLLKKGASAIHKLGNITRDCYDAELIMITEETDEFYIGQFAEGLAFVDVEFRKEDCRKATIEELDLCDQGKMREIKF